VSRLAWTDIKSALGRARVCYRYGKLRERLGSLEQPLEFSARS
jgi:hypothetical protein